jgi:hypothetical protein
MKYASSVQDCCAFCDATPGCSLCELVRLFTRALSHTTSITGLARCDCLTAYTMTRLNRHCRGF